MASNHFDAQASTNYKEAFALFDKRGNGRVAIDSLGDLLRACGQNPTLAEIDELQQIIGTGDFDFDTFLKHLNRPGGFRDPGPAEAYYPAFEVFDKDRLGKISKGELKYMLLNLGEKMTEQEVDQLLEPYKKDEKPIDYPDMIKTIISN